jgi:hypothetical protein
VANSSSIGSSSSCNRGLLLTQAIADGLAVAPQGLLQVAADDV